MDSIFSACPPWSTFQVSHSPTTFSCPPKHNLLYLPNNSSIQLRFMVCSSDISTILCSLHKPPAPVKLGFHGPSLSPPPKSLQVPLWGLPGKIQRWVNPTLRLLLACRLLDKQLSRCWGPHGQLITILRWTISPTLIHPPSQAPRQLFPVFVFSSNLQCLSFSVHSLASSHWESSIRKEISVRPEATFTHLAATVP